MAAVNFPTFDSSVLLNYYAARMPVSAQATAAASSASASAHSATANDQPPWENTAKPSQQALDAQVLGTTKFIDLSKVPPNAGGSVDQKTEQDNQKLFALYQAVNT